MISTKQHSADWKLAAASCHSLHKGTHAHDCADTSLSNVCSPEDEQI